MKSFTTLIHDAIFSPQAAFYDERGNYKGSAIDQTPWMLLLGRIWGIILWLYIILLPLLAPVYYGFANWFCNKYDAEFTKEDPKHWPQEKAAILKRYRTIFWCWIIFIALGFLCNWGQHDGPGYYYTQPSVSSAYYKEHGHIMPKDYE